jgi:transposase
MFGCALVGDVRSYGIQQEGMPMELTLHKRDDADELSRRIRQERNAKQRDRYRAVVLALEGKTAPEIRRMLGRSRRFVQTWVYAYRDKGIDGLLPKRPPGRPSKLTDAQRELLKQRLDAQDALRRGVDLRREIQDLFGVTYSLSGAFLVLHDLGYEPLKPRPVNPKKDPEDEAIWKQMAPLLSSSSGGSTRTGKSKSGSRTNADSAKRGA